MFESNSIRTHDNDVRKASVGQLHSSCGRCCPLLDIPEDMSYLSVEPGDAPLPAPSPSHLPI